MTQDALIMREVLPDGQMDLLKSIRNREYHLSMRLKHISGTAIFAAVKHFIQQTVRF
jgi:hypothetical protein